MNGKSCQSPPPLVRRTKLSRKQWAVIVAAIVLGWALLFWAAPVIRITLSKAPFEMIIEPESGQTVVYFRQPSKALVSPRFPVNAPSIARTVVVLDSPEVKIPAGSVESCDTTLLPGYFVIHLGGKRFDIAEARILVDGKQVQWQKEQVDPAR